jgi:hypothetical protein
VEPPGEWPRHGRMASVCAARGGDGSGYPGPGPGRSYGPHTGRALNQLKSFMKTFKQFQFVNRNQLKSLAISTVMGDDPGGPRWGMRGAHGGWGPALPPYGACQPGYRNERKPNGKLKHKQPVIDERLTAVNYRIRDFGVSLRECTSLWRVIWSGFYCSAN